MKTFEPNPLSPERLSLKKIREVKHRNGAVELTATFLYPIRSESPFLSVSAGRGKRRGSQGRMSTILYRVIY
jgi:hypothetical protein